MTERDIAGNVRFLVEAWQRYDALTREIVTLRSRGAGAERADYKKAKHEREQIELGMKQAATDLAVGVLVDLHRCADALESIADTVAAMNKPATGGGGA